MTRARESEVMRNVVKDSASSGARIRGVHLTFAAPAAIEVLAAADIDFVYLDGEHGCFDWRDIEVACLASERHGLTPIARVPDTSRATITRFLDRGVKGIVAPHIETVDEALGVVDAAYFSPLGGRSFGGGRPEYGLRIASRPAYIEACNASLAVCLMLESQAGIDAAGELAKVAGVDYLSFGLLDLAQSLGQPGNPDHPDVKAAVADASSRIRSAGKRVREDFMQFVWINDVLLAGTRQLLGTP
jgi:2-keto-3-deoxy-L-rhamnonate aldolase RhmA